MNISHPLCAPYESGLNGRNINFYDGPLANNCNVSKNLIYIAALLSNAYAASFINLALSTSAYAEITLA